MSSDQRRDQRFDADLPVQLLGGDKNIAGNLRNFSISGAAIEFEPDLGKSQVTFEIGDSVDLQTDRGSKAQTEAKTAARGIVVRQDANGISIKFEKPEDALMSEILSTVKRFLEQN